MAAVSGSLRSLLIFLLGVAAFSLLEYRALDLLHGSHLPADVDVAAGILSGHPYWKAYQNRLFGPALVFGTAHLTGLPPATVYRAICYALLCLANATAGLLLRRAGAPARPVWWYVVAYAASFVAFQDPEWLYLWDYVDLTTMLLFAWAVIVGWWPTWWFTLLFLVELANRESAQFIALWLVLDALLPDQEVPGGRRRWVDWSRLGWGVGLGLLGTGWTHWVRNAFCIQETGIVERPEIVELSDGQFLMVRVTLDLLREPWNLTAAALAVLLIATGWSWWRAWGLLGRRAWKVAALLAVMVAANASLSFIYELRVWLPLVPFVLCLAHLGDVAGVTAVPAKKH